jgi:hypothetical protein
MLGLRLLRAKRKISLSSSKPGRSYIEETDLVALIVQFLALLHRQSFRLVRVPSIEMIRQQVDSSGSSSRGYRFLSRGDIRMNSLVCQAVLGD